MAVERSSGAGDSPRVRPRARTRETSETRPTERTGPSSEAAQTDPTPSTNDRVESQTTGDPRELDREPVSTRSDPSSSEAIRTEQAAAANEMTGGTEDEESLFDVAEASVQETGETAPVSSVSAVTVSENSEGQRVESRSYTTQSGTEIAYEVTLDEDGEAVERRYDSSLPAEERHLGESGPTTRTSQSDQIVETRDADGEYSQVFQRTMESVETAALTRESETRTYSSDGTVRLERALDSRSGLEEEWHEGTPSAREYNTSVGSVPELPSGDPLSFESQEVSLPDGSTGSQTVFSDQISGITETTVRDSEGRLVSAHETQLRRDEESATGDLRGNRVSTAVFGHDSGQSIYDNAFPTGETSLQETDETFLQFGPDGEVVSREDLSIARWTSEDGSRVLTAIGDGGQPPLEYELAVDREDGMRETQYFREGTNDTILRREGPTSDGFHTVETEFDWSEAAEEAVEDGREMTEGGRTVVRARIDTNQEVLAEQLGTEFETLRETDPDFRAFLDSNQNDTFAYRETETELSHRTAEGSSTWNEHTIELGSGPDALSLVRDQEGGWQVVPPATASEESTTPTSDEQEATGPSGQGSELRFWADQSAKPELGRNRDWNRRRLIGGLLDRTVSALGDATDVFSLVDGVRDAFDSDSSVRERMNSVVGAVSDGAGLTKGVQDSRWLANRGQRVQAGFPIFNQLAQRAAGAGTVLTTLDSAGLAVREAGSLEGVGHAADAVSGLGQLRLLASSSSPLGWGTVVLAYGVNEGVDYHVERDVGELMLDLE